MISLKIKNIKTFMSKLLTSETFDVFLLESALINTYNSFMIDGHQNRDFYSSEEWEDKELRPYDFSTWKQIRPICFSLIKGTRTPSAFKFTLHLMPEQAESILKGSDTDVTFNLLKALVLTVKYDGASLNLITGTAFHVFIMDKSIDNIWDSAVKRFLDKNGLDYEEM